MSRRYLTTQDVRRAGAGEIVVEADTLVTPQALAAAEAAGISIRTEAGPYSEPAPRRGPDAPGATEHLPRMPEPVDDLPSTGVVVTCVGRNRPGVLAELTTAIAHHGCSIGDVSQKMVDDYFHMVLVVELTASGSGFKELKAELECLGGENDYVVRVMHERVFRFMHRI
ncbi:MAG: ACT domain-containing protein [Planctomycetota bacterium]|jgi:ACT domain-containing protein|nr:ACT domain-containing protein [Planctomycetota bacterium]MDP6763469.1 ACT domain-containing protein [Planctomycetota bacterium]MDP6990295.1 ACT domain-containing protein [Planctomycetota bacterium]